MHSVNLPGTAVSRTLLSLETTRTLPSLPCHGCLPCCSAGVLLRCPPLPHPKHHTSLHGVRERPQAWQASLFSSMVTSLCLLLNAGCCTGSVFLCYAFTYVYSCWSMIGRCLYPHACTYVYIHVRLWWCLLAPSGGHASFLSPLCLYTRLTWLLWVTQL